MAKPIPEGFNTLTPHIVCKDAAQAIEFYKKALGAKEMYRMPAPDGAIMHAEMSIGNSRLMIAEENPQWGSKGPTAIGGTPVTIHLYVENCDALYQQAIGAGATSAMEPQDAFWGDRYARFVDPYGHSWAVATHKEDLTPEEIGKRAAVAFQH